MDEIVSSFREAAVGSSYLPKADPAGRALGGGFAHQTSFLARPEVAASEHGKNTIASRLVDRLHHAILAGELKPGAKINLELMLSDRLKSDARLLATGRSRRPAEWERETLNYTFDFSPVREGFPSLLWGCLGALGLALGAVRAGGGSLRMVARDPSRCPPTDRRPDHAAPLMPAPISAGLISAVALAENNIMLNLPLK
jgi:hypothetical protein